MGMPTTTEQQTRSYESSREVADLQDIRTEADEGTRTLDLLHGKQTL
jgi:hypothetical protein